MNTNAPEKIYLTKNLLGELLDSWNAIPSNNFTNIEYIRKDAFIEKTCEYFHRCLEDTKIIDDYRNILVPGVQARYTSVEEFIEEFINYMRGE